MTSNDVQLNSENNEQICEIDNDSVSSSSIGSNDHLNQNQEDRQSNAEQVTNFVRESEAVNNVNLPNQNQSCVPAPNNHLRPNIHSITMQNSANPLFGDKTVYEGPVTIYQIVSDVQDKEKWNVDEFKKQEGAEFKNISDINKSSQSSLVKGKSEKQKQLSKCRNKNMFIAGLLISSIVITLYIVIQKQTEEKKSTTYKTVKQSSNTPQNNQFRPLLANMTRPITKSPNKYLRYVSNLPQNRKNTKKTRNGKRKKSTGKKKKKKH